MSSDDPDSVKASTDHLKPENDCDDEKKLVVAGSKTARLEDEESVALIMASFDDSLLKLTSLEDVCRFVRDELSSTASSRTALLSAVLGELEEVQRQANTLPLTTFFHTHAAFETFVNNELGPAVTTLPSVAAQLQFIARRAWCDRTMIAGRKRKFMYMSGHIWHFVNTDMCNEFCFVIVTLCAARALAIRNVYAVLSESHCWLGYLRCPSASPVAAPHGGGDAATSSTSQSAAAPPTVKREEYDDINVPPLSALEFLDILPPDRSRNDIISSISESRSGWAYQRDASGAQRAVVLTPQQLVAAMLVNVELTPDVKLPLLCAVPDEVAMSLPSFVLAQAMCYHACGDVVHAAVLYDCAVNVARERFGDALVYPLLQRAEFHVAMGHFGEALTDFVDMARVIRSYNLLETDAEMLDEATVAAAHVCDNVVPALVAMFSDDIGTLRAHFSNALQLYDHLLAWIEAAHVDPGVAWHTAVSLAFARHFPAVSRVDFGASLLAQCGDVSGDDSKAVRTALVERLYASRVMRFFALRLIEMAAKERDDDVLVRDVIEIFRRCAQHPLPPTTVVVEPPVDQLADSYAEAINEPWRAAAEDARIRQALAEAANGLSYKQVSGMVLPWPKEEANGSAAPHVGASRVRRRSDPIVERAMDKLRRDSDVVPTTGSVKRNRTDGAVPKAAPRKRPSKNGSSSGKGSSAKKSTQRRKAAVVAAVLVTNEDASSGDELVEWTQCERCDRWVVLGNGVSAASLPAQWFCEMNTWSTDPDERVCPKLQPPRGKATANGVDDFDGDDGSSVERNGFQQSNGTNKRPNHRGVDSDDDDDSGEDVDDDDDDDHIE